MFFSYYFAFLLSCHCLRVLSGTQRIPAAVISVRSAQKKHWCVSIYFAFLDFLFGFSCPSVSVSLLFLAFFSFLSLFFSATAALAELPSDSLGRLDGCLPPFPATLVQNFLKFLMAKMQKVKKSSNFGYVTCVHQPFVCRPAVFHSPCFQFCSSGLGAPWALTGGENWWNLIIGVSGSTQHDWQRTSCCKMSVGLKVGIFHALLCHVPKPYNKKAWNI